MSQLTYGQLERALRRVGFVRTATGAHNLWERMDTTGAAHRVIVCGRGMRLVPAPVLERLARHAGLTPEELNRQASSPR